MRIVIDPTAEITGFGYVEPGQYRLRVVKVEQMKGKKAPYLHWEFEFVDPTVKATDGKSTPGHVFENTTLCREKNAQFMLRGIIESLGCGWADFDTESVVGLELDAMLKTREYEGKISNELAKVLPQRR